MSIEGGEEKTMTEDRISRMFQQIFEDLRKLEVDFQKETSKWVEDLLKDAFDPTKMMQFIRGMGIDMGQLSQVFSRMAQTGTLPQGFDPYQILGLEKSATDEEVKRRYREMMRKIHPDVAGQEMTFLAAIVNAAYDMIERERGWQ